MVREWRDKQSDKFELYVSELVVDEISRGDASMARKRSDLVEGVPLLDVSEHVIPLAEEIALKKILPAKAGEDISHIAVSAVHEMDFLLTLNCKHIANAFIYRRVEQICRSFGYEPLLVCTPQEILEKKDKINER